MEKIDLPSIWDTVSIDYDITKKLGEGSYGSVVEAKSKQSGQRVAIKLIKNCFRSVYSSRKVLREILILHKLSDIKDNNFTTKLIDIILPQDVIFTNEYESTFIYWTKTCDTFPH